MINNTKDISPINSSFKRYNIIPNRIKPIPVLAKRNSFNEDFEKKSPKNTLLNLNINYHSLISSFVGKRFNLNLEKINLFSNNISNEPDRGGLVFPVIFASGYFFIINFDTLSNSG